ncbi:MAG TPA: hypothetical protein VNE38_02305, partial [Ktedonobacteraceae bacterium]|nr:hypothetical protein [Ktedonobacteraceae bacterium]
MMHRRQVRMNYVDMKKEQRTSGSLLLSQDGEIAMKSPSRILKILIVILGILIVLNAIPIIQKKLQAGNNVQPVSSATQPNQAGATPSSSALPGNAIPAAIAVNGTQWGQSTCYIGATEGSSNFNIADLTGLGINAYHIYGGMSRWEAQDDSSVYGYPT